MKETTSKQEDRSKTSAFAFKYYTGQANVSGANVIQINI